MEYKTEERVLKGRPELPTERAGPTMDETKIVQMRSAEASRKRVSRFSV